MAGRRKLGMTVLEAAIDRLEALYSEGHRIVHSYTGGKDSACVVECAITAAERTGRLPVEVVIRDEELGFPDLYECVERTANRPEVELTWVVAGQPHSYAYDRECPFWWVFDDRVPPERWMRQPPSWSVTIEPVTIEAICTPELFPPPAGADLVQTIGIRAGESLNRMLGVHSQGGHMGKRGKGGVRSCWPIYDWSERDVWTAIKELHIDVPSSYSDLWRAGVRGGQLRQGAFLNRFGAAMMPVVKRIWPAFWDRMCARYPDLRWQVEQGDRLLRPQRRVGETWERCYERTCIDEAPAWIAERSAKVREQALRRHGKHASGNLPEEVACKDCGSGRESWRRLAEGMFLGDPFSEFPASSLPYMEPQDFRPELAGTPKGRWGGHPG